MGIDAGKPHVTIAELVNCTIDPGALNAVRIVHQNDPGIRLAKLRNNLATAICTAAIGNDNQRTGIVRSELLQKCEKMGCLVKAANDNQSLPGHTKRPCPITAAKRASQSVRVAIKSDQGTEATPA